MKKRRSQKRRRRKRCLSHIFSLWKSIRFSTVLLCRFRSVFTASKRRSFLAGFVSMQYSCFCFDFDHSETHKTNIFIQNSTQMNGPKRKRNEITHNTNEQMNKRDENEAKDEKQCQDERE